MNQQKSEPETFRPIGAIFADIIARLQRQRAARGLSPFTIPEPKDRQ